MHTNDELRQIYINLVSGGGRLPFNPERHHDGSFVDSETEINFYWFQRGFKTAAKEMISELNTFVSEFEYPA